MTMELIRQARVLLIKAAEDEKVLDWKEAPDGPFGFHVQQAIEKLFMALLVQLETEFTFTHDLNYLAKQLKQAGEILPVEESDLSNLGTCSLTNDFDDIPEFIVLDRSEAIATVRLIREHVVNRIAVLSDAPLPPPLQ
jgi:HEPN domain-containing protein